MALASSAGEAQAAAVDYFLKIDGIEGESTDAKHKNEIEILSFSWGVANTATPTAGGGGGAGKATFQDLTFNAQLSKASPKLFLACAGGQHLRSAVLTVRKAGKENQEFYTIRMDDVVVSSVQNGGSVGAEGIFDSIALNFSKITWSYAPQKADGTLGPRIETNWDIKLNKGG